MAISLFSERSLAAASHRPFAAFTRWVAQAKAVRARRNALTTMLELDQARLADLGITRADIQATIKAPRYAGTEHVLNAARARNARL